MERLAPEDIQAIIIGVASNRQFIQGIAEQVKEAIRLPTSSSTATSLTEEGVQQSGSQPGQQRPPLPTQGWSRDKRVINFVLIGRTECMSSLTGYPLLSPISHVYPSSRKRVTHFLLPRSTPLCKCTILC